MKRRDEDPYVFLVQIGKGSYAKVYKAINRNTGELCAIKKISTNSQFDLKPLINEAGIMKSCNSKNIVKYITNYFTPEPPEQCYIVMEYCSGGSVKDVMRQLKRTITEDQIRVIVGDVLNGLHYLHTKNKIHRDVKAANIMLDKHGVAKLGDFGVSEKLHTQTDRHDMKPGSDEKRQFIGTLLWLPPEVINKNPQLTSLIDIWSLGVTVIEMGDGQPPYSKWDRLEPALEEISDMTKPPASFDKPSQWSANMLDFLSLCLVKDDRRRKSARELLSHKIFDNPPSRDKTKDLVAEVCAQSLADTEPETNLERKVESSLKENAILFGLHQERKMKVVRVSQLSSDIKKIFKEFSEIENNIARKNNTASELRKELQRRIDENRLITKDINELNSEVAAQKDERARLMGQIDLVRIKRRNNENAELQRKLKLKALERASPI